MRRRVSLAALVFVLMGCSTVSEEAVFKDVAGNVQSALNAEVSQINSQENEDEIARRVRELLRKTLTPDSAVQVALLNNRALQATFEELGIARADLIEATSLPNPLMSVSGRFPSGGGRVNLDFGITEDFLSLLYLPLKRSVAQSALNGAKGRVSYEVMRLASEVREAFYELQATQQDNELLATSLKAAEASFVASKQIYDAGNSTELELRSDTVLYEQTKLELARSETQTRMLREKINSSLGLWGSDTSWTVGVRLPEISQTEVNLTDVEERAVSNRFDLLALKEDIETTAKVLGIAAPLSVFNAAEVGIDSERETDGGWVTGPSVSFPLPLFNQGAGAKAHALSQYRAALFRYYDLAVRIRSEARMARDSVVSLRQQIEFIKGTLIPLRHSIVKQTQIRYNGMLLSVFTLLMAKQSEIDAGRQYIAALKDYWIARSKLEFAIGGNLSAPKKS